MSRSYCEEQTVTKRAYKFRCYPTDEQKQILARTFGCCRWVYNWALRLKTDAYRQEGKRLSSDDLSALLPTLKQQPETAWLAEVSSVPLQQSLRHLNRAFVNFFEDRAKYPRFNPKSETHRRQPIPPLPSSGKTMALRLQKWKPLLLFAGLVRFHKVPGRRGSRSPAIRQAATSFPCWWKKPSSPCPCLPTRSGSTSEFPRW